MINSETNNILLMGLPATGKTTFLAALWYAVQQPKDPTALILDRLDGDCGYLNVIRDAWLQCKPVGRNPVDSEKVVSMWLKSRDSQQKIHLTFPDVSGESFSHQWCNRELTKSYAQCLTNANGAVLFVNADSLNIPVHVSEVDALAALIELESAEAADESEGVDNCGPVGETTPEVPDWQIENAPTQVQLIELLQFMMLRKEMTSRFRLAVVISAWDLVEPHGLPAETWIHKHLPMLSQFLSSNKQVFDVAFFGISAQGGDYETVGLSFKNQYPLKRIEIFGAGVNDKHDITEPLLWLVR